MLFNLIRTPLHGAYRSDFSPGFSPSSMSHQSEQFQDDVHQNGDDAYAEDPRHLGDTLIWGTTVVVQTCMNIFRMFIENFNSQNNATVR